MSILERLKREKSGKGKDELAVIIFSTTFAALRTEKLLKRKGVKAWKTAPPDHIREGCTIAVEIELKDMELVSELLTGRKVNFERIVPYKDIKTEE